MNRLEKIFLSIFLLAITGIHAQVGVGTRTPNPDAMLEVSATNKGLLLPRIALTASTAASPLSAHVAGMTVFNTASVADVTPGYYYNDGGKWLRLASDAVSDATTTVSGKIKLAGDLGGTADAPTVPGLATKVDKVTGKELSTNDYTTAEKNKLAAITGTNTGDQDLSALATNADLALKANTSDVNNSLATKVDKVTGKELSTNDYTTAEKNKLAAITGTNTGDQDLSTLATVTALALKEDASNKSATITLGNSDLLYPTQNAVKTYVDSQISAGVVDATALVGGKIKLAGDLGGTADAPTVPGLALKANTTDVTTSLAAKENTITAGTTAQYFRGDKSFQTLDKIAVGLANVDNTTDAAKPISDLTQAALDLKAPLASPALSGVPTAPTAAAGTNTTQLATTAFVTSALGYDKLRGTVTTVTSSSYTIAATDYLVITNAGTGVTITFPDLTAAEAGRTVFVFNNNTAALNNLITGTNVIGQQTNSQFRAMEFVWSGAQWFIMGK